MANLLIRNLPPELHARLKASAAAHRRSLTQEAILIVEKGLAAGATESFPRPLAEPLEPRRPLTMEETRRWIDEGHKNRSQPGWAKGSLRILHPVEGTTFPEGDWNMLHEGFDPLK